MHPPNQFDLLAERRFAPFFWTQFLGAGNDNVYKNALVIFVAFHAANLTSLDPNTLVNLAGAVFIAPFMLFSATAGQLADKFEKSRLIRWIKLFEIAIMAIGLAGFWRRDLTLLFTALALLGVHSTLFGPVKYAILPQQLKPDELIGGNGLVEMGTFVAILLGTIVGGLVVAIEGSGPVLAGGVAVAVAVAGYAASRKIPPMPPVDPGLALNWNPFSETWKNLAVARENRVVWLSMLGISWFWFYGATFLAQFAGFARDSLGGNEHVVTLLLASLLDRHRRGIAAVRTAVGPARRARSCPVRLDRAHRLRGRPVAREPQHARDERWRGSTCFSRARRIGASRPISC